MKNIIKTSAILAIIATTSVYSIEKISKTLSVAQQSGADCGYHALKNGYMAHLWLTKQWDTKTLNKNINSLNPAIFPLENWRNAIIRRRKSVGIPVARGTNIIEHEIEFLAKAFLNFDSNNYTIIPNVHAKNINDLLILDAGLIEAIRKIKSNYNATHVFIVGNMTKNSLSAGHWVSIVVQKEANKLYFYSMDSLGGTPTNMLNSLKNIIEHANIDVAQINIEFEPEINRIENILRKENSNLNQKLQDSLDAVTKVIDLAIKKDLIHKPCFHCSLVRILQILNNMVQLDPTKDYKFAFEAMKLYSKFNA